MKNVLKVLLVTLISINLINCSKDDESTPNLNSDTENPILPDNFKVTVDNKGKAFLNWGYASDNVGIISYEIKQNDKVIKLLESSKNSFTIEKLKPLVNHTFAITGIDKAGNRSIERKKDAKFIPSDPNIDTESPVVSKFIVSNQIKSFVTLSWKSSDIDIVNFIIKLNDKVIATIQKNIFYYKVNISPNIDHNFSIVAIDKAGNVSQEKKVTANYFPPKNSITSSINGTAFLPSNKLDNAAKIMTDTNTGKENVVINFNLKEKDIISSVNIFKMIIPKEGLSKGNHYNLQTKSPDLVINFSYKSKLYTKFISKSTLDISNFSDEKIEGTINGFMEDELSTDKIDISIEFSLNFNK